MYLMRKATLALGLVYILYALWLFLSVFRISSLYQEFGANLPLTSFLLPVGVLGYGLIQSIVYFANFKNKKTYTALFIIGLVFIILWISYLLVTGYIANREFERVLDIYERKN